MEHCSGRASLHSHMVPGRRCLTFALLALFLATPEPFAQGGAWKWLFKGAASKLERAAGTSLRASAREADDIVRLAATNALRLEAGQLAHVVTAYAKHYAKDAASLRISPAMIARHADDVWPSVTERLLQSPKLGASHWTPEELRGYVYTAVRNEYVSRLRKSYPHLLGEELSHISVAAAADEVIDELIERELMTKFLDWRASLCEAEREAWICIENGYTNERAARDLEMSLTSFKDMKSRLALAFKKATGVELPELRGTNDGLLIAIPIAFLNQTFPGGSALVLLRPLLLAAITIFLSALGFAKEGHRLCSMASPHVWSNLGCGVCLVGRRDPNATAQSCTMTRAITLLKIPLFAVSAHRIFETRPDPTILHQVPLSKFALRANAFVALAVLIDAAIWIVQAW